MAPQKERLTVLFADDQIPDENIPDDEIKSVLKKQHPEWPDGFIGAFVLMRRAVKTLRGAGYKVTVARTLKEAINAVEESHFDIAIVDLGWSADKTVPDPDYKGWDICEAIRKADQKSKELGVRPTLQIMYSDRFLKYPSISIDAADHGVLPAFKNYENPEAGRNALKAAVKFVEKNLSRKPIPLEEIIAGKVEDYGRLRLKSLTESLEEQRLWSRLTLAFVALSILLLLAGATSAIRGNIQVGTLTSISSLLTTAISSLLFLQLHRARESAKGSQEGIKQEYQEDLDRLYELRRPSTAAGPPAPETTSS